MDRKAKSRIEQFKKQLQEYVAEMRMIENEKPRAYDTVGYKKMCKRLRFLEDEIDWCTLVVEFYARYP